MHFEEIRKSDADQNSDPKKENTARERETIQSQRPLSSLSAQLAIQTRGLILVKIDLVVRLAAATFLTECTREASVCVSHTQKVTSMQMIFKLNSQAARIWK